MKPEYFLSQRLGFSNAQADTIQKLGVKNFLKKSFDTPLSTEVPKFLADAPKTRDEYRDMRKADKDLQIKTLATERLRSVATGHWWLSSMHESEFPLREKMTLFWHNHFTSGFQKVKISWAMYQQNQLLRTHAFGNYRELTRQILYDNAMIMYLDNNQNRKSAPNENLSRELLELFTLGVGNYTEQDIKEGARALAGLSVGDKGGQYYRIIEDNTDKTYLGKKGNLKADDMVAAIFAHPRAGRHLMNKFLKFFVSDTPSVAMVEEYTQAFRKADFEMKPMLEKLVEDKRFLSSQGAKVKDPVSFLLGSLYEFGLETPPTRQIATYFQEQGMVLLNPPNVKGWDGGRDWLSSQKLLQRVGVVNLLAQGKPLSNSKYKNNKQVNADDQINMEETMMKPKRMEMEADTKPVFKWNKNLKSNKDIIADLSDRLLFAVSKDLQTDMENLLKYDFDPKQQTAQLAVTRLAEFIMKSPEYQII
jgi:uncharacterized protein (DUF1800 family)